MLYFNQQGIVVVFEHQKWLIFYAKQNNYKQEIKSLKIFKNKSLYFQLMRIYLPSNR
jgi:hypothetical protein